MILPITTLLQSKTASDAPPSRHPWRCEVLAMTVRQADNWEADKAVLLDFAGLLRARHRVNSWPGTTGCQTSFALLD